MSTVNRSASHRISALCMLPQAERRQHLATLLDAEPALLPELAEALGLEPLSVEQCEAAEIDFSLISLADALLQRVLPLRYREESLLLLGDPFSLSLRQWAHHCAGRYGLTSLSWIDRQLESLAGKQRTLDQLEQQNGDSVNEETVTEITPAGIAREANSVVKLLNATLYDALQSRASDIHLSAVPDGLLVKYRIDGVLHSIRHCAGQQHAEQVISRLKVLSCMDIAERRVPQDGRFKALIQQRPVDFRVSMMPGVYGEDAVLRVLDKSHDNSLRLESLGFDEHTLREIRSLTHRPHGMVLVTGPTGSGKSTTLYAAISELNSGESKIITIEDPVEYQLTSVLQIPVNDKKGLTFARGLRAILRHDPDIVLVGEIRDGETAAIAVQAALTGHMVLSSVHANDVFSVLERFLYMQVEPASLITALNGVVAQRLVRRICTVCARDTEPDSTAVQAWQAATRLQKVTPRWQSGEGCEACRGSGYHGRIALAEVLRFSDAMKEALLARLPVRQLKEIALREGFISLQETALHAVLLGETTYKEINRVIGDD